MNALTNPHFKTEQTFFTPSFYSRTYLVLNTLSIKDKVFVKRNFCTLCHYKEQNRGCTLRRTSNQAQALSLNSQSPDKKSTKKGKLQFVLWILGVAVATLSAVYRSPASKNVTPENTATLNRDIKITPKEGCNLTQEIPLTEKKPENPRFEKVPTTRFSKEEEVIRLRFLEEFNADWQRRIKNKKVYPPEQQTEVSSRDQSSEPQGEKKEDFSESESKVEPVSNAPEIVREVPSANEISSPGTQTAPKSTPIIPRTAQQIGQRSVDRQQHQDFLEGNRLARDAKDLERLQDNKTFPRRTNDKTIDLAIKSKKARSDEYYKSALEKVDITVKKDGIVPTTNFDSVRDLCKDFDAQTNSELRKSGRFVYTRPKISAATPPGAGEHNPSASSSSSSAATSSSSLPSQSNSTSCKFIGPNFSGEGFASPAVELIYQLRASDFVYFRNTYDVPQVFALVFGFLIHYVQAFVNFNAPAGCPTANYILYLQYSAKLYFTTLPQRLFIKIKAARISFCS